MYYYLAADVISGLAAAVSVPLVLFFCVIVPCCVVIICCLCRRHKRNTIERNCQQNANIEMDTVPHHTSINTSEKELTVSNEVETNAPPPYSQLYPQTLCTNVMQPAMIEPVKYQSTIQAVPYEQMYYVQQPQVIMPTVQQSQVMPTIQQPQVMPTVQQSQVMPIVQQPQVMPTVCHTTDVPIQCIAEEQD